MSDWLSRWARRHFGRNIQVAAPRRLRRSALSRTWLSGIEALEERVVLDAVAYSGPNVIITGSSGNDEFKFLVNPINLDRADIWINNVDFGVWIIGGGGTYQFDGLGGTDRIDGRGTFGNDTYSIGSNTATINGLTYTGTSIEDYLYNPLSGNDVINVTATSAGLVMGGSGSDTVQTVSGTNHFNIADPNIGDIDSLLLFREIENVGGGSGDDTFNFWSASGSLTGTVNGGGGTNLISYEGRSSSVSVNLGAGTATGVGGGISNIRDATGGSANDVLNGSSVGNLLKGMGGADTIDGAGGDDAIFGGDYLYTAADTNDNLSGGTGNDSIFGGAGDDTVSGGDDDDTLYGGYLDLTATDGADNINGDAGNDTVTTGLGADSVSGGANTDTVDFQGTSGADTFSIGALTVTVNGVTLTHDGTFETKLYTGNAGNDSFTAAGGTGLIMAGADTDTFNGPTGNNRFNLHGAGAGNLNTTLGFRQTENLVGNTGNDIFSFYTNTASVSGTVDGGGGTNLLSYFGSSNAVTVNLGAGTASNTGGISNILNVEGSSGNDTITGDGNGNDLKGGDGSDTIDGGAGADFVWGGTHTYSAGDLGDNLSGGLGNDSINGGAGGDTMSGGDDADHIFGGTWSKTDPDGDDSISGGSGNDTIQAGLGNDTVNGDAGIDYLLGGFWDFTVADGNDTIDGGTETDLVLGGQGADTISGGDGGDRLHGGGWAAVTGDGDDLIVGGAGNDTIDGGNGRDFMIGGGDQDHLSGGADDDLAVTNNVTHGIAALSLIAAEWSSGNAYATRVSNIQSGGGATGGNALVAGSTVTNDSIADYVFGGADTDWFILTNSPTADVIGDLAGGETVTNNP